MNQLTLAIVVTAVALAGSYVIGKRMSDKTSSMVAAGLGILAASGWKFFLGITDALSVKSIVVMIIGVIVCGGVAKLGQKAR